MILSCKSKVWVFVVEVKLIDLCFVIVYFGNLSISSQRRKT